MANEYAVELATSNIRFGAGVTRELGMELADRGIKKVMLLTDRFLTELPAVATARSALDDAGIEVEFYNDVSVEPTDSSFRTAIQKATDHRARGLRRGWWRFDD